MQAFTGIITSVVKVPAIIFRVLKKKNTQIEILFFVLFPKVIMSIP